MTLKTITKWNKILNWTTTFLIATGIYIQSRLSDSDTSCILSEHVTKLWRVWNQTGAPWMLKICRNDLDNEKKILQPLVWASTQIFILGVINTRICRSNKEDEKKILWPLVWSYLLRFLPKVPWILKYAEVTQGEKKFLDLLVWASTKSLLLVPWILEYAEGTQKMKRKFCSLWFKLPLRLTLKVSTSSQSTADCLLRHAKIEA